MTGRWKIKHPDMQVLARQGAGAHRRAATSPSSGCRASSNKRADAAANESMDRRESFRRDLDAGQADRADLGRPRPDGRRRSTAALLDAGRRRAERARTLASRAAESPRGSASGSAAALPGGCGATRPPGTPPCSAAGVRVARCHDLRLCHAILARSPLVVDAAACVRRRQWDAASAVGEQSARRRALFELGRRRPPTAGPPHGLDEALDEFARQRRGDRGSVAIPGGCACSSPPSRRARSSPRSCAPRVCRGMPQPMTRILTEILGERPPRRRTAREARPRAPIGCARRWATRARASTRSRSCCGRCTASACWSSRRAAGSSPSTSIRSSSRCWSTRSSRACNRRTAGPGSTSGCRTAGSGPSTCPGAS